MKGRTIKGKQGNPSLRLIKKGGKLYKIPLGQTIRAPYAEMKKVVDRDAYLSKTGGGNDAA